MGDVPRKKGLRRMLDHALNQDEFWMRPAIVMGAILLIMLVTLNGCTVAPRMVEVETGPDSRIKVAVLDDCFPGRTGALADVHSPDKPTVYLCGLLSDERHELDHWRGMRHSAWVDIGIISCTTVTASGYKTRYQVGQRICMNKINRQEWTE